MLQFRGLDGSLLLDKFEFLQPENAHDAFAITPRVVLHELARFYGGVNAHTAMSCEYAAMICATLRVPRRLQRQWSVWLQAPAVHWCGPQVKTCCVRNCHSETQVYSYAEASFADLLNLAAFTCVRSLGGVVDIPQACDDAGVGMHVRLPPP